LRHINYHAEETPAANKAPHTFHEDNQDKMSLMSAPPERPCDDIGAGLLLDEWLDRIPSTSTSAGVSSHYGEPKARALQFVTAAGFESDFRHCRSWWLCGMDSQAQPGNCVCRDRR
jgi:hypothetical protein